MSYDLNFWKYKPGTILDHQKTYELLSEGQQVDGLEELPIESIIQRIATVFSDWERLDNVTWESSRGTFQLFTTPQFFRVDCYELDGDEMNKIIEVAAEFECPLFDPQVGKRFEQG